MIQQYIVSCIKKINMGSQIRKTPFYMTQMFHKVQKKWKKCKDYFKLAVILVSFKETLYYLCWNSCSAVPRNLEYSVISLQLKWRDLHEDVSVLCVFQVNKEADPSWSSWNRCLSWAAEVTSLEEASGLTSLWNHNRHCRGSKPSEEELIWCSNSCCMWGEEELLQNKSKGLQLT